MKLNFKLLMLLSMLVLIAGGFLYFNHSHIDGVIEPAFTDGEEIDLRGERQWTDLGFQSVDLKSQLKDSLFNAMILYSIGDNLFVNDYGDTYTKRFTRDGKYLTKYGYGSGRGPGEVGLIMDFTVWEEQIWKADLRKFEVMGFDLESGELKTTISSDFQVSRVAPFGEGQIAVMGLGSEKLFKIYDLESEEELFEFGELIERQLQNTLSMDGRITYIEEFNELVYMPYRASLLYFFDLEGDVSRIVKTRDGLGFQESRRRDSDGAFRIVTPNTDVQYQDIEVANDMIYVLGFERSSEERDERSYFIDVYTLSGEEYHHSISPPAPARRFAIIDDIFYMMDPEYREISAYQVYGDE